MSVSTETTEQALIMSVEYALQAFHNILQVTAK